MRKSSLNGLRENYHYRLYPIPRYEALGLKKYYVTIYSNYYRLHLLDLYDAFDGNTTLIFRDVNNPLVINAVIYYNSMNFDKVSDYLLDEEIIFHYDIHKIEKEEFYPIDYSIFNFNIRSI
ncbi:MAG: hypothetical protein RXR43_09165 [Sulfolobus sp.]